MVTEALAQEEEKLIAEGQLKGGKFGFSVNSSAKCNIYVIADGYALFLKKGRPSGFPKLQFPCGRPPGLTSASWPG